VLLVVRALLLVMSRWVKPILCPILVGRDKELRTLTGALDRTQRGSGCVVIVTGDAGVGKSALCRELSERASARGVMVLTGRAVETSAPLAYRPVAEALMRAARQGLSPTAHDVAKWLPTLGRLVPYWSQAEHIGAELTPHLVGDALIRLMTQGATRRCVLLLEDLQWADPETLAVVKVLAERAAEVPLLCIATIRDSEPTPALDTSQALLSCCAAVILRLGRLAKPEVRKVAAACLGADDVPDGLSSLLASCGGLPFVVEEMLAAAVFSGQLSQSESGWHVDDGVATGVPTSVTTSISRRLALLGQRAADVLAAAAVLGEHFNVTLLPAVVEISAASVREALRQAADVQLIERSAQDDEVFNFRHSLIRHAILADLLMPDVVRLSTRASAVIRETRPGLPGAWCELVAELHSLAGQSKEAASCVLEAGRRALRQGALETATSSLRKARELAELHNDSDQLAAIDEALITALGLAGNDRELGPVAARLKASVGRAGSDRRRRALTMIMTSRASRPDNPTAALSDLPLARSIAEQLGDHELASQADVIAARCALDIGHHDHAEKLAGRALVAAEQEGLTGWAAEAAVEALQVIGRRHRLRDTTAARAAFERAHHIARNAHSTMWRIEALQELGTIEMLDTASERRLVEASRLAHGTGAVSLAVAIDIRRALIANLGSDLDRALKLARESERTANQIQARRLQALAAISQAFTWAIKADEPQAESAAGCAERTLPDSPEVLFTTWGLVRPTASLFEGDLEKACQQSAVAMSYADQVPDGAPRLGWALYALLQSVNSQDGPRALEQARSSSLSVRWNRGFHSHAAAVLEGRQGHGAQAEALVSQGQVVLEQFAPRWNHLLRWLAAHAALSDGWGDPVTWLTEAASAFDNDGYTALATTCRDTLRHAGHHMF
jgi:hypothetical protein